MKQIIAIFLGATFSASSLLINHSDTIFGVYKYISQGVSTTEISFNPDTSFTRIDNAGLATIKNKGIYEVVSDTIFLTYTAPSISNDLDTFINSGHYQSRKDTFWIINENEISEGESLLSPRYYQIEEWYINQQVKTKKEWEVYDTTYTIGNHRYFIQNRQRPHGTWTYWDADNNLIKEEIYLHGQKK